MNRWLISFCALSCFLGCSRSINFDSALQIDVLAEQDIILETTEEASVYSLSIEVSGEIVGESKIT